MHCNEHWQYIRTVRKYERLAVSRSRLFRLFVLALTAFVVYLLFSRLTLADEGNWAYRAAASTIPYMVMKYVSIIEAFFLVFLLSECRFNAFDDESYSDVFLNHPPSNADYYLGKIWGYMQLFCRLNLFLLLLTLVFNLTARQALVDVVPYIVYGVLYTVPMLLFVLGLSTCIMLRIRHTSVVMLLVPGLLATMFLLSRQPAYAWLDFSAFRVPVFHSSMAGWIRPEPFLVSRIVYLCVGLALCCLAVALVPRRSGYRERPAAVACCMAFLLLAASGIGYHIQQRHADQSYRDGMIALNDACTDTPLWQIHDYRMDIRQQKKQLEVEVCMTGTALEEARTFAFCLNPGLRVDAVEDANGRPLPFIRREQMLLIDFPTVQNTSDTTAIQIRYHGRIDRRICFLDMGDEWLDARQQVKDIVMPASDVEQRPSYCLLTPDSYWYPRMGTSYTNKDYKWQRQWFSHFDIHVVPLPRLFPVTQGVLTDTSDGYRYVSDVPVPSLTLAIGPYERITGETPSCNYHVVYQKGHDYFRPLFDGKGEEILQQVDHLRGDLERNTKISYQASQYTLVEVPASYAPPQRWWALNGRIQPQLCLIPEKAFSMNGADMYSAYLKEVSETGSGDGMMGFMMFAGFLFIGEDYGAINQLGMFNYDVSAPWLPGCNAFFANRSNLSTLSEPPQGANAVLADHSLAELVENQTASGKLIKYKIRELCLRGCLEVEDETFWDCLKDVLRQHPYASLQLEQVFDMLADTIGINLNDYIDTWYHGKGVPYYQIEPVVLAVKKNGRDTYYEISQIVTNESAYAGIVVAVSDAASKTVEIPPFSSRRFVLVSAQKPFRYDLMTGISLNLPSSISYRAMVQRSNLWSPMPGEAGQTRVEEGPRRPLSDSRADEIIVDNEDAGFSFGFARGIWKRWYAKSVYPKNEYFGGGWLQNIPTVWRSVLRSDFFGGRIRSACVVRSTSQGAPAQEAVWKIPVPRAGRYAVSHHFVIPNGEFGNTSWGFPNFVLEQIQAEDPDQVEKEIRKLDLLHHFRLRQSSGLDKKIDFQSFTYNESPGRSEQRREFVGGWQTLDTLDLRQDTLYCTLSNRTDLKLVIADAIRLIPVKEKQME